MSLPPVRPPRTPGHGQRDVLLQRFSDAGLVPVLSTNGSTPDADIQIVKTLLGDGGQHGEVIAAYLTNRGQSRLDAAAREARTAALKAEA